MSRVGGRASPSPPPPSRPVPSGSRLSAALFLTAAAGPSPPPLANKAMAGPGQSEAADIDPVLMVVAVAEAAAHWAHRQISSSRSP